MSMLSFDEVGLLLDDMAEEFPPEFFDELNGGVALPICKCAVATNSIVAAWSTCKRRFCCPDPTPE